MRKSMQMHYAGTKAPLQPQMANMPFARAQEGTYTYYHDHHRCFKKPCQLMNCNQWIKIRSLETLARKHEIATRDWSTNIYYY